MAAVQPSLREQILRRKPVTAMTAETGTDTGEGELKRSIGLFQLSMFGIGATIGTGIFFVLTEAVPVAGPAVIWSFVFAGVVAGLTAICYAELASAVPVSGSSYSYAYATLGELVAMVVAACLLLEYGVSAAAVAVGWSQYLNELFDNLFGFTIPDSLSQAPEQGGIFNLPAVLLVGMCALLLIRGASESAKVNAVMVSIKLGVLVLFIVARHPGLELGQPVGLHAVRPQRHHVGRGHHLLLLHRSRRGLDRRRGGQEPAADDAARDPDRARHGDHALRPGRAGRRRGAADGGFEGQEAGLSAILEDVTGATWPATVLAAGAVISIFSVTLVVIYGQTRILFAMGRDGMIPPLFHRVNPRTLTPVPATIIVAVVVSLLAGVLPINFLAEMTSIGTLVAFMVVSVGVIMLRRSAPDLPRGFKVPGYPVTPLLAIAGCIWIVLDLRFVTIAVFVVWTAVAIVWYFAYGIRHSMLGKQS